MVSPDMPVPRYATDMPDMDMSMVVDRPVLGKIEGLE